MKKINALLLISIAFLLLLVSCNDSNEGLFQSAMQAEYEESFKVLSIIGRSTDQNTFYLSTDDGIYSYNKNGFSHYFGDGKISRRAIYANENCIIYETSEGSGEYIDAKDSSLILSNINGYSIIDVYSPDGKSFTYIFKKGNDYFASTDWHVAPVQIQENPKIVGDKTIRCNEGGSYKYYTINGTVTQILDGVSETFVGLNGTIDPKTGITANCRVYKNNTQKASYDSYGTATFAPISSDGKIIMYPYVSVYFSTNGDDVTPYNTNGTSSICPIAIMKKADSSQYLVFTSQSGAYVLNDADHTMTSLRNNASIDISDYAY